MTLDARARKVITRLVTSVLQVKPLAGGVAAAIRIVPVGPVGAAPSATWSERQWARLDRLLDQVARRTGVAGLVLSQDTAFDDLQVFERVVSNYLALAELADFESLHSEGLYDAISGDGFLQDLAQIRQTRAALF